MRQRRVRAECSRDDRVNQRISVDPQVCSGKQCIRGTRIMVRNIRGMFAGAYDLAPILDACPELSAEDIAAALEYATRVLDEDKVVEGA